MAALISCCCTGLAVHWPFTVVTELGSRCYSCTFFPCLLFDRGLGRVGVWHRNCYWVLWGACTSWRHTHCGHIGQQGVAGHMVDRQHKQRLSPEPQPRLGWSRTQGVYASDVVFNTGCSPRPAALSCCEHVGRLVRSWIHQCCASLYDAATACNRVHSRMCCSAISGTVLCVCARSVLCMLGSCHERQALVMWSGVLGCYLRDQRSADQLIGCAQLGTHASHPQLWNLQPGSNHVAAKRSRADR